MLHLSLTFEESSLGELLICHPTISSTCDVPIFTIVILQFILFEKSWHTQITHIQRHHASQPVQHLTIREWRGCYQLIHSGCDFLRSNQGRLTDLITLFPK